MKIAVEVNRPAIYELQPNETLRDLLHPPSASGRRHLSSGGGFTASCRPTSGASLGKLGCVVDVGPEQFAGGIVPAVPMVSGDSVTVLAVPSRLRGYITVRGNVWVEGQVGFSAGMKLSDAIRLAGGPKPDVYVDRILVSRTNDDSTKVQLRSAFADSTGKVTEDLVLHQEDEIRVFSRAAFLPTRYVTVVGAVRNPGRVPYRDA